MRGMEVEEVQEVSCPAPLGVKVDRSYPVFKTRDYSITTFRDKVGRLYERYHCADGTEKWFRLELEDA